MADALPYLAEYSKSNRAACKKCKEKIEKDVLRLAVVVQVITNSYRHEHNVILCFLT